MRPNVEPVVVSSHMSVLCNSISPAVGLRTEFQLDLRICFPSFLYIPPWLSTVGMGPPNTDGAIDNPPGIAGPEIHP